MWLFNCIEAEIQTHAITTVNRAMENKKTDADWTSCNNDTVKTRDYHWFAAQSIWCIVQTKLIEAESNNKANVWFWLLQRWHNSNSPWIKYKSNFFSNFWKVLDLGTLLWVHVFVTFSSNQIGQIVLGEIFTGPFLSWRK